MGSHEICHLRQPYSETKSVEKGELFPYIDARLEQPITNWAKRIDFDLSRGTRRGGWWKKV